VQIIVKSVFGSHLYGTDTPESDKDYKGIFMPSKEEIFLGKIPKSISETTKSGSASKNTADDIDTDMYSLQYFIELALKGETVALDMLHTPTHPFTINTSPIWEELKSLRSKFYTKNLKSFVGYCRKQAAKYGIKGSRISAAKSVMDLLYKYTGNEKMQDVWDKLPIDEHLRFIEDSPNGLKQYQVCGKIFQESVKTYYVVDILEKFVEQYGKRARLAERNEGIDWKAVSHALRAAYQTKMILEEGTIIFPLPQAEYLRLVKQGKKHYMYEVSPILEGLMEEIEILSANSSLPKKPDRKFWERFVVEKVEEFYGWS
jgi:thermostable 8-oxoguanine DNA glycosylase